MGRDKIIPSFFLLLCVCACIPLNVYGERSRVDSIYEKIRAPFLKLRNTDPRVLKESEWREAIAHLLQYARNGDAVSKVTAFYDASVGFESLCAAYDKETDCTERSAILDELLTACPGDSLCDDALVRKAKLHLAQNEREKAYQALVSILRRYPSGDQVSVANALIAGIQSSLSDSTPQEEIHGPCIVIDPGHGGEDRGAVGKGELLEKDVSLDIALHVRDALKDTFRVILTREGDSFVPLEERAQVANNSKADLFISIHANASESGKESGFEVYVLDSQVSANSKIVADRENRTNDKKRNRDLDFLLGDLLQSNKRESSLLLARAIEQKVVQGKGIQSRGVLKAPLYVLAGAQMPAVLVEVAFIDNADEGKQLADPLFRKKIARSIAEGARTFLKVPERS